MRRELVGDDEAEHEARHQPQEHDRVDGLEAGQSLHAVKHPQRPRKRLFLQQAPQIAPFELAHIDLGELHEVVMARQHVQHARQRPSHIVRGCRGAAELIFEDRE